MISVVNPKKYFSDFLSSLRPSFTPISSFECNGVEYIIEGKKPGILSRDLNYYFRVENTREEHVREVFQCLDLQHLMSRDKRVRSNKFSIFKIEKAEYNELKEFLGTVAPPHFSPPNSKRITEENIFKRFETDVLGIPQTIYTSEPPKIPEHLRHLKVFRRRSNKPPLNLIKKS